MSGALASALVIASGAAVGGFVQGLTGFAFSVVALSFWAWALPPQTAAPLAVFGALLGQLSSLVSFRGGFEWRMILPLVVGGCLGVPLGVFLLHNADPRGFRLAIGLLLTAYCLFALFVCHPSLATRGGRPLDAVFGMIGGVLGGFGGMSGFMPAVWTQVRGWNRDLRRATMQAYNISMHVLTISFYFGSGTLKHADLGQFAIVLPAMLIPSVVGARVYQRFSDRSFTRAVMVALLFSGVALVVGALRAPR